jgi:hypothetical protein
MSAFYALLAFDAVVVLGFGGLATRGHAALQLRRRTTPKPRKDQP